MCTADSPALSKNSPLLNSPRSKTPSLFLSNCSKTDRKPAVQHLVSLIETRHTMRMPQYQYIVHVSAPPVLLIARPRMESASFAQGEGAGSGEVHADLRSEREIVGASQPEALST
jgi:hypothetical protein